MMGHGMAKNLMKAGNDLTVIAHRNRAPVDDLVGLGALESQIGRSIGIERRYLFLLEQFQRGGSCCGRIET